MAAASSSAVPVGLSDRPWKKLRQYIRPEDNSFSEYAIVPCACNFLFNPESEPSLDPDGENENERDQLVMCEQNMLAISFAASAHIYKTAVSHMFAQLVAGKHHAWLKEHADVTLLDQASRAVLLVAESYDF